MPVTPELYQRRPEEPQQAEAVRFVEDNAEEVAEWIRQRAWWTGTTAVAEMKVEIGDDGPRILMPALFGWRAFTPGWVLYLNGGDFQGVSNTDVERDWERAPDPADPSLCSCVVPRASGAIAEDDLAVWDPDCKGCGKMLTPEALASVTDGSS